MAPLRFRSKAGQPRAFLAICRREAFLKGLPWQDLAVMHPRALADDRNVLPGVRQWQDLAAVRSRAAIRGGFFASCVPEGASDGKSAPSWQHIAAMHPKRAGFGKIFAPCIRKAPQTVVWEYTARRSCHEGALFAARASQIMHGAQILPFLGAPFECFGLSRAGRGRCSRFAHCPPCFVRAARLFRGLAHTQLLFARIAVVASASRPNWQ